jgi:hypothetical protein
MATAAGYIPELDGKFLLPHALDTGQDKSSWEQTGSFPQNWLVFKVPESTMQAPEDNCCQGICLGPWGPLCYTLSITSGCAPRSNSGIIIWVQATTLWILVLLHEKRPTFGNMSQ